MLPEVQVTVQVQVDSWCREHLQHVKYLLICDELEGVNFHLFNDEQKLMIAHKRQVFYI